MVEQVPDRIVALVEVRGKLRAGVLDVDHRVADGTGEVLVPCVIEKRNETQYRQGNTLDGQAGTRGLFLIPTSTGASFM